MTAPRPSRGSSYGPTLRGYLTEAQLAARWSRSPNTLVGWRTRQQAGRGLIAVELIDGVWYYRFEEIRRVEADADYAWVRPLAQRHATLPPLSLLEEQVRASAVEAQAPQIPLGLTVPVERKFVTITESVHASQLIAVADDGTAWVSTGLGLTDDFTWHPLPSLPAREVPSIPLHSIARAG